LARERIAALDQKIAELKNARNALLKLARACEGGVSGPCPILVAFDNGADRRADANTHNERDKPVGFRKRQAAICCNPRAG
jgi:hypothetical protein